MVTFDFGDLQDVALEFLLQIWVIGNTLCMRSQKFLVSLYRSNIYTITSCYSLH